MDENQFKETKEKSPFYLKVLDGLAPIYQKFGADYEQVRLIVQTKMKMDGRQENPVADTWGSDDEKKKDKNSFFSSLWIYVLISFFMLMIFIVDNYIFQFTFYFSYLFVMMIAILISHFSNVLLDPKDQELIGTKPVSSKTLGAAKATHISIYLLAFSFAISGVMVIASFIFNGVAVGLLTILLTLLASVWCLILTILIYAYVLRRFNGEKLKNIISYSQIGLSIFMIIGFQIMGNLFQIIDPEALAIELNLQWWHIFVFPLWFVAPYGLIEEGWSWTFGVYIALLVAGTIGLILLYRLNSDKIDRNLQKINSDSDKGSTRSSVAQFFANALSFNDREKPYFHFAWQLTKNEREFKTRLYPSIVSALIFPLVFLWTQITTAGFSGVGDSPFLPYIPYFTVLMVPMTSTSLRYSNHHKARWLFTMSPENDTAALFRGVLKAIFTKLIGPIYVGVALLILFFSGLQSIPVMVNGFLLTFIIFYLDMAITMDVVPFTQLYNASEANRGCVSTILFFVGVWILAMILFLFQMFIPISEYIILIILLAINGWIITRGFKKKTTKPIVG